jgi:hypothetical protein
MIVTTRVAAPLSRDGGLIRPVATTCPWRARSDGDPRGITVAHEHVTLALTWGEPGQAARPAIFASKGSSWRRGATLGATRANDLPTWPDGSGQQPRATPSV